MWNWVVLMDVLRCCCFVVCRVVARVDVVLGYTDGLLC